MINLFREYKRRTLSFVEKYVHTKYADLILAVVAFTEASFFILPPDVILIAILMYGATRWVYYATFTTIFSVIGGLVGYLIGSLLFDSIGAWLIDLYNLSEAFVYVSELYQNNAFWTVFASAFTPLPYKLFALTAGVFEVSIPIFIVASLIGRALRYFFVAYIMKVFGRDVLKIVMKYFNAITVTIIVIIVLLLIL